MPAIVTSALLRCADRLEQALFSDRPGWAMMPSGVASNFVDNLLFVLSLLDHLGIEHYAHYGTLLGAVHLGGVAPWDEDADVFVVARDLATLRETIEPLLGPHGFEVIWTARRDALLIRQTPWLAGQGHIGLSLHPGVLDDDQDPAAQAWDAFMRRSELYPLRRHAFHGSYVVGPARPDPVLARLYGSAGSADAMRRFSAPPIASELRAFWARARPIDGDLDWPAIARRFRARARGAPWHASTFPWWWWNGAYNIGVRRARWLGGRLRARLVTRPGPMERR